MIVESSRFGTLEIEDGDLALPVTNAWAFFADYEVELSDADGDARRRTRRPCSSPSAPELSLRT